MIGKIIDLNITEALISFQDGSTVDVGTSHLPSNIKIGDAINIDPHPTYMLNDKFKNISPLNIL